MDNHREQEVAAAVPREWREALDRSDADMAAGRTTTWQEARVRLLRIQADIEAEQARRQA